MLRGVLSGFCYGILLKTHDFKSKSYISVGMLPLVQEGEVLSALSLLLGSLRTQARREETGEEVLQGALSGHRQRRVCQLPHDLPVDRDPQAQLFLW
jgi:hypothetical protein